MTGECSRRDLQEGQGEMLCPILLEVIMGEHKGKIERYERYRDYKEQGHSLKEVAEHFGISNTTAVNACRGIAPQKAKVNTSNRKNQYTCQSFDREQNAIKTIEERTPGFEYAGGFTHCDGEVLLRRKKCGSILRRSMISVRKKAVVCDVCRKNEATARKEKQETERAEREAKVAEKRESREAETFLKTRLVACNECGTIFATKRERQLCCSKECARKRNNRLASHRKDTRIAKEKRIDKDITVQGVFARDGGICWICGGRCNTEDYRVVNGTVICGRSYPSIDHVVPICEGGTDAWENVKLAHRQCNTLRFNKKIAPPLP